MNEKELSKYLSYILRHKPEEIGLELDSEGWGNIAELIKKSQPVTHASLSLAVIQAAVTNSDKKRFQISDDGLKIRAVQGHSTAAVNLNFAEKIPPVFLYHGTALRFIDSIKVQGLLSKERQYVHLTEDQQTAASVGSRYGKVKIIIIEALKMHNEGFKFYQAENNVWLVNAVPVRFTDLGNVE
ncbi:RNA 2'-phosphotransferase [Acinetobacter sp.]|uniref:RNA 2'-phosphotransferase n=1 Tax=Acinetobacter sp. TaxID=472 RepID=UPI002FC9AC1C